MINFKSKNNLDKITFANHCNICNVIMRKYEKNIIAVFFVLIFVLPILIKELHDIFIHDYSHEVQYTGTTTFIPKDNGFCLIHLFKYFKYDFLYNKNSTRIKYTGIFPVFEILAGRIDENIFSYYCLRAPPFSVF